MLSLIVGLVMLLSSFPAHAAVCNCDGCNTAYPVGHSNWCSCCQTSTITGCNIVCPESIYDADQCRSAGYGRAVCRPSNSTYDAPGNSGNGSGLPWVPSDRSIPSSASNMTDYYHRTPVRVCNCLLCQYSALEIGGANWCRCCGVLFDNECAWTYRCDTTVFTQSGCLQNNWNQVCAAQHHSYMFDDAEAPEIPATELHLETMANGTLVFSTESSESSTESSVSKIIQTNSATNSHIDLTAFLSLLGSLIFIVLAGVVFFFKRSTPVQNEINMT